MTGSDFLWKSFSFLMNCYRFAIIGLVLALGGGLLLIGCLLGIAWWKMLIIIAIPALIYLLFDS
ncbi:MAG: hypothetical protein P1P90_03795 [Patescibacteria group bacterium]|nr:hypothetical protein [Patescibacteria group bacterium]